MKLNTLSSQILGGALCLAALGILPEASAERLNFDRDWKFAFGNASDPAKDFGCGTEYFNYLTKAASIHNEGPYAPKFDDSECLPVTLPHAFVVDSQFAKDASHSHG
ncbi:MAG: beta-galactosidase, partial [Muribaculaceae bacterium]|nr:beta-galactosidase [Muribaculaceae bacterium]